VSSNSIIVCIAYLNHSYSGGRLEWWCLKWNQRALDFYEGIGAKQMSEWMPLRVDGENLKKLAEREIDVKSGAQ
jgi:hypothetical protein